MTTPAIVLVCAASIVAAQAPPERPDREGTLAAARRLINDGKPREAIASLDALGDRASPEVAGLLGVAYYHADDHERAIALLAPILGALPADSTERHEAVQVLGLSLFLSGKFARALPYLEQTREWARDNMELGYVLGQTYIHLRQADRARETFASVFAVAPESAAAHLIAAQMMNRLEQEALAEAELERGLEKRRDLPHANYLLGQMALFRGRLDEAIALTRREIAVNPGNAMAYYQLGDAYVRQSKWDDAIAALQQSLWLNPFYSGPYILLGKAYMKKAQPATAEGMLRRAIQYDPNNRTAHYLLAQLLQQMGRAQEAKREFEIAERLQGQPGR